MRGSLEMQDQLHLIVIELENARASSEKNIKKPKRIPQTTREITWDEIGGEEIELLAETSECMIEKIDGEEEEEEEEEKEEDEAKILEKELEKKNRN
ncbi:hypothetical protein M8J76_016401 [Diaphorina citri]|nr:hypothetical protein M8J76_016401 [Diaphorina citri]